MTALYCLFLNGLHQVSCVRHITETLRNCFLLCLQTLPTTQYELEIVAKDMAGSEVGLTGTTTATITITDRNDHAPEFTHSLVRLDFYILFLSSSSLIVIVKGIIESSKSKKLKKRDENE